MAKTLECVMCKEIETIKHLMFECIVARVLWDDVFKIFDINVTDFESIASKWLCNKKNPAFQPSIFYSSLDSMDK
jgi:hypothetical protein